MLAQESFSVLQRPMLAALENEHIQLNASLVQHVGGSSSVRQLALHCKKGLAHGAIQHLYGNPDSVHEYK
jgi:hypothetical protein